MQHRTRQNGLGNVNWDHRQHTRANVRTGFQTGGIISDTADAIGDGADWVMGVPGDTLKGLGDMTGDAWDWGVGGTADATASAWDWGVGGTANATEEAWDWAVGGAADATEEAWDWAAGGTADAAGMGGGNEQPEEPQQQSGMSTTMMMAGGAAILGLGGAYYMSQR